jgi:2-polyprenyl-6-methoxyphenol hydroxylase-like FAD-dependent oxidoreductase
VVIAGAGVAAAAVACGLSRAGFRPLLLRVGASPRPGAEALPPEARAQIHALDWGDVFLEARAVEVDGFENHLDDARTVVKAGPFLHVDRARLAEAALRRATDEGAVVLDRPRLPALLQGDAEVVLPDSGRRFFAAVDATGRASAWSRPRRRAGSQVADLFQVPGGSVAERGLIVAASDGWAYRIGLPGTMTIGLVSATRRPLGPLDRSTAERLGVLAQSPLFLGRRPAFPQWAESPVLGRRLAVGDAAFASDPIAGQGLRFALASALAATSTLRTMRDTNDGDTALAYYREFVSEAVRRHLESLDRIGRDVRGIVADVTASRATTTPGIPPAPLSPFALVQFVGGTISTGLNIDGVIVPGTAVALPGGGLVRWLGSFDILVLRDMATTPVPLAILAEGLGARGLSPADVGRLLLWCQAHGLITTDGPGGWRPVVLEQRPAE